VVGCSPTRSTEGAPLTTPARPSSTGSGQAKPWEAYRREPSALRQAQEGQGRLYFKLLEPGWGGYLDDAEVDFILSKLRVDPALAYWWGFRGATRRRPVGAIKSVAMWGNPEVRADNVKLVRSRQRPDTL
jgi:hypothetical protein